jgi:hypothetical protein
MTTWGDNPEDLFTPSSESELLLYFQSASITLAPYSSSLKEEVTCSFVTPEHAYKTAWWHDPECSMNTHSCGKGKKKKRWSYLCKRPWRPIGLWDVESPTLSRQSAHRWRWGQPYAPAVMYPPIRNQRESWWQAEPPWNQPINRRSHKL